MKSSPSRYYLNRGPKWMQRAFNRLVDLNFETQPLAGAGLARNDSPLGRLLSVTTVGGGKSTPVQHHPFQLLDASNPDDGTQVRIIYGTVNGIAPSGMSDGDEPPYILPLAGTGVIWLIVTTDADGDVTSVSIDLGSTVPDDGDTTFYLEIGSYQVVDHSVAVADNLTGSQEFNRCRDWFSNPASYSADWSGI